MATKYSLKKDGEKNLTANFKVKEFRCMDGSDEILIDPALPLILQSIRDYFGKPVHINSAYRTPAHNKKIGGVSNSQHIYGTAADITIAGVPPLAVCEYVANKHLKGGGIGVYRTFSHVDVRANRARWDNRSGREVGISGFPGTSYTKYKAAVLTPDTEITGQQEEQENETTLEIVNRQDEINPVYNTLDDIPDYFLDDTKALIASGALLGTDTGLNIPHDVLRAAIIMKRYVDCKTGGDF